MVLTILEFIFQDFWHWAGTAILLGIITSSFSGLIKVNFPFGKKSNPR